MPPRNKKKTDTQQAYQATLLAGTARSTRRAYERDVRYFWAWAKHALTLPLRYPVSLETVLRFILDHAGHMDPVLEQQLVSKGLRTRTGPLRVRTIRRYLASLSVAHSSRGFESPMSSSQVSLLLRRLQRVQANLPTRRKAAITAPMLKEMVATCENNLRGCRDKAILLVGFAAGGRRRSELVSLQVEDLKKIEGGYLLHLRASKTDPGGQGLEVPVLGEAAKALSTWLVRSGLRQGHLFRGIGRDGKLNDGISGRTINRIVKRRAEKAGLDAHALGAHSLRSGFITESGRQGAALGDAMALSGHRNNEVALGYYRDGELLANPAARLLD